MEERSERVVERVAGLKYWRAADARVVVEAYRRSGWTAASFARRYGIKAERLRRWARELEGSPTNEGVLRFHPVRVVERGDESPLRSRPIEIVTRRGASEEALEYVLCALDAVLSENRQLQLLGGQAAAGGPELGADRPRPTAALVRGDARATGPGAGEARSRGRGPPGRRARGRDQTGPGGPTRARARGTPGSLDLAHPGCRAHGPHRGGATRGAHL